MVTSRAMAVSSAHGAARQRTETPHISRWQAMHPAQREGACSWDLQHCLLPIQPRCRQEPDRGHPPFELRVVQFCFAVPEGTHLIVGNRVIPFLVRRNQRPLTGPGFHSGRGRIYRGWFQAHVAAMTFPSRTDEDQFDAAEPPAVCKSSPEYGEFSLAGFVCMQNFQSRPLSSYVCP
jgi:hypothetical protein